MRMNRRKFIQVGAAAGAGGYVAVKYGLPAIETVGAAGEGATAATEQWLPTTCWIGKQECGVLARSVNGRIVKLEGNPANPRNQGTLCPKGMAQIISLYDPNRVKKPLIRTNAKGLEGAWREASWDEALTLAASKIKETRDKNPKLVLWQKGRSKSETLYDNAFVKAIGAVSLGHGAFCSDAGYRACEYTIGLNGVLHPDMKYTNFMLSWGYNLTGAGGNKLCWIAFPRQFHEARVRGMKVVTIDPRIRQMGPHSDRWLPVRPGRDLALALAFAHVLVEKGFLDREYLTKYTNSPFLVGEDGMFLTQTVKVTKDGKDTDVVKQLVWDTTTGGAVPFDAPGATPALEGSFTTADGKKARTSFDLYKDHVARYTPEALADDIGVPAADIRDVAETLGREARIGSTITVDGVALPYRPVGAMYYHAAQQELGFEATRAILQVFMLVGAIGAVGGQRSDMKWNKHANFDNLDQVKIKDPPYDFILNNSPYFPINDKNPAFLAKIMQNPAKYGASDLPELVIVHNTNPVVAYGSTPDLKDEYSRFKFVIVVDPWVSETASLYADVVLPASTLEKWEGPNNVTDTYVDAVTVRVPPMDPLYESRMEVDIYMDLCEKLGLLTGASGYIAQANTALGLKDANALPTDKRPTPRAIFDAWAKQQGVTDGAAFFEKNGVYSLGAVPLSKQYGYAQSPAFAGIRHRLYGESLLRYQQQMKAKGVDRIYWQDYTALPTWRKPTMDASPAAYDLYLFSFKKIELKQGRASFIPLLNELAPEQRALLHPDAGKARGIADNDWVWVESQNAVTGETRRVKTRASLTELVRPDTVGMSHHYGLFVHPYTKDTGPSPNAIFYTGEGYVSQCMDQSFHVKVKVTKAGDA